jgi:nitrogen fixation/metabolism regulation signal transduction histidine kinase
MGFKRYNGAIWVWIILTVLTSVALGWALAVSRIHLAILLSIVIAMETGSLFLLLTRNQRNILHFFRSLENTDTALNYTSPFRGKFVDELHQYLNNVNKIFQEIRLNNELQEQFFSKILKHLSHGFLVIAPTGHINFINPEALRLLQLSNLTHVQALAEGNPKVYAVLKGMESLQKREITIQDSGSGIKRILGLHVLDLRMKGEDVRIVTLQDLSVELEKKEIDDWIRLIRVMSHEIMNSLAPITSISTTLKEVWSEDQEKMNDKNDTRIRQTIKGLDAIAEQSEGLTTFFESYRVLSRIPDPHKRLIPVCLMLEKLQTLTAYQESNEGIKITVICEDPDLKIFADEQMITQVLLNLVRNASQALENTSDPAIAIQAENKDTNEISLSVVDNGPGIPPDIADEIFMPFFTTRQKGTGVGLSYSRQVLAMNGGRIEFDSIPGRTEFRVLFGR